MPTAPNTAPIPRATLDPCRRCGRLDWLDNPCWCTPRRVWPWQRPLDRRSFALGGLACTALILLCRLLL